MSNPRAQTVLQAAGLLACGLAAVQGAFELVYGAPDALRSLPPAQGAFALGATLLAELLLFACFAWAFWWNTRRSPDLAPAPAALALLALQAALALTLSTDLLYVVAAEVPFVLRGRRAVLWICAQALATLGIGLVLIRTGGFVPIEVLGAVPAVWRNTLTLVTSLSWEAFAFAAGWMAASETRGRLALARVNAELLATQELLAGSSRLAERLSISRELHDSLGHHLAALAVNLELAGHLAEGKAAQPVREAHTLARLLLGEVREVVSALRDNRAVDLPGALRTLASGVGGLAVHLAIPEGLEVRDPEQAHALFRCAQEAITNTLKHAGARNLWIALGRDAGGGLELAARDDGQGAAALTPGNGLRGMRERLEGLGGRLEVEPRPGAGLALRAWTPGSDPALEKLA